jgi:hypothetical protein
MHRSIRRTFAVLVLALLCAVPALARPAARPVESLIENVLSTLWDVVKSPLRLFRPAPSVQKDGVAIPPGGDDPTTNSCPQDGCTGGDGNGGFDPNG